LSQLATPNAPAPLVLLAEDQPEFVGQIIQAFDAIQSFDAAKPPKNVWCCDTGGEALQLIANPKVTIELALVDIGLPDISGIEVIRAARQRFPDIPILVVSVLSDQQNVVAAIRAGARGYIVKGDSHLSIAQAIQQAMAGIYPISAQLARHLFSMIDLPNHAANEPPLPALAPREVELLQQLSHGYTYAESADRMSLSLSTIQSYVRSVYRKLDVHTQVQAVRKAQQHGLIER
jgi:DNA-binding NarL/FixJ family response regulator